MTMTKIGRDYDYAPELIYSGATRRSDIYQIGLILYFCFTGYGCFGPKDGTSVQAVGSGVAQQHARNLNSPLGSCIAKMLDLNPAYRYDNCIEAWKAMAPLKTN